MLVLFGVLQDCGFGLGVFGVFVVVVWWCQHPARELVLFGVLQDCGFGVFGVFVVVFFGLGVFGVFVVVFLWWWCVVVFLRWWCGGVNIRPENSCFSVFCNKDVTGPWYHDPLTDMITNIVQVPAITILSETSGPRTDVEFSW